jgi:uncharacterized protein YlxW (UPF0749 family)
MLRVIERQQPSRADASQSKSCLGLAGGLSIEQAAVAAQMRQVKHEVRRLKEQINKYQAHGRDVRSAEVQNMSAKLATLRSRWSELEIARERAWKRKMVALGYDI